MKEKRKSLKNSGFTETYAFAQNTLPVGQTQVTNVAATTPLKEADQRLLNGSAQRIGGILILKGLLNVLAFTAFIIGFELPD